MGKKLIFEREVEVRREKPVYVKHPLVDETGAAMFGLVIGIVIAIVVAIVAVILVQNGAHP
ncbi:MAG: hypothetical protein ACKVP0_07445 [Pirellulaceae bacterium]